MQFLDNSFTWSVMCTGTKFEVIWLQVLLSLPHIKQEDLLAFDDSLSKTASPKEQKQHMRSLLLLATGNKLRALAAQKTTNVITNVTSEQLFSFYFHYCVLYHQVLYITSRKLGSKCTWLHFFRAPDLFFIASMEFYLLLAIKDGYFRVKPKSVPFDLLLQAFRQCPTSNCFCLCNVKA